MASSDDRPCPIEADRDFDASPELRLLAGDVVAVAGRREVLLQVVGRHAGEVEDRPLLDLPIASIEILLTNRDWQARRYSLHGRYQRLDLPSSVADIM